MKPTVAVDSKGNVEILKPETLDGKNVYKTVDLFMVAYLFVKGFKLLTPPYFNKKQTILIYNFEETPELSKAVGELLNGTALVEPMSILERHRSLKTQLGEVRRRLHHEAIGGGDNE